MNDQPNPNPFMTSVARIMGIDLTPPAPTRGWRFWNYDNNGLLCSRWGSRDTYHQPFMTAECRKYGCISVPGRGCHCGVHFVPDRIAFFDNIRDVNDRGFRFPIGLIEPVGRTIPADHEKTFGGSTVWRTKSARILTLVIDHHSAHLKDKLEDTYGVKVHVGFFHRTLDRAEREQRRPS